MWVGILGPLEVGAGPGDAVDVGGARLRALLIRLAIDVGRQVTAQRLIDDLWEGDPPAAAANALQALVSRLRGVVGRDLVESTTIGYRLALEPGRLDAVVFERDVTSARRIAEPAGRAAALSRALGLWRGPALADVADAGFAQITVKRLEELRLAAIEDRADAELALGDGAGLVPELEAQHAAHPLRERTCAQLIRAMAASGRQADALGLYERTRHDLAESLGVDPSPALAAAHLAVLRGAETAEGPGAKTAAAPGAAPPRAADRGPRTNIPARLTSFVGRDEEIKRLGELLEVSRLVTLTGPGGAGKTRLACEVAARKDPLEDGVWFVQLAPVRSESALTTAVLESIGMPEASWEIKELTSPLDRLLETLEFKRLLIVLDNCEHLIGPVAALTDRMLAAAPGVRVLATSREPLGITGEMLCPVPSLPVPPEDAVADDPLADDALSYGAVRLFADRVSAVRPGFALDTRTTPPAIEICRALDGIPLAIELAAARLRTLTLAQVAERLDDRFRLLTVGSRTALPRHQTLRAVVDWSWDLLDDAEREVLRRLSAFPGGADPEAAECVCGPIDVVAALIDKSLLVAAEHGEQIRYRLLETVRVYAAERLAESGEEAAVRTAHAAYYVDLAERADPELRRGDQARWTDRLTAERANCAAALRFAIDTGDVRTGLRLFGALMWFWVITDFEMEAIEPGVELCRLAGDAPPPGLAEPFVMCTTMAKLAPSLTENEHPPTDTMLPILREALRALPQPVRHPLLIVGATLAAMLTGDADAVHEALAAMHGHGDPWVRAIGRTLEAHFALNEGRPDEALAGFRASRAAFSELGDRFGLAFSLGGLGIALQAIGRYDEAIAAYDDARRTSGPDGIGPMLINAAKARMAAGDLDRARADVLEAIRMFERKGGQQDDLADGHVALSELARREDDLAGAADELGRASRLVEPRAHRIGFDQMHAITLTKLGCLAEQRGEPAEARRLHERATAITGRMLMMAGPVLAMVAEGWAALYAATAEFAVAAELLGIAHTVHGCRDESSLEVRRTVVATTAALGADGFAAAYERGRAVPRAEAMSALCQRAGIPVPGVSDP
jgi:predicted ATPase/DNA-binding SARP family transcriptional activator